MTAPVSALHSHQSSAFEQGRDVLKPVNSSPPHSSSHRIRAQPPQKLESMSPESPPLYNQKSTPRPSKQPAEPSGLGLKRNLSNLSEFDDTKAAATPGTSSQHSQSQYEKSPKLRREAAKKAKISTSNLDDDDLPLNSKGLKKPASDLIPDPKPSGGGKVEKSKTLTPKSPVIDTKVDSAQTSETKSPGAKTPVLPDVSNETRQKGPCSYPHCHNPHHSSGGGFKIVTTDTKAGHQDWTKWVGRVFCNACFTQYATRATFDRPGRQYPADEKPEPQPVKQEPSQNKIHINLKEVSKAEERRTQNPTPTESQLEPRPLPTKVEVAAKNDPLALKFREGCVEISVEAYGRNVKYQWYKNGQMIPGAVHNPLLLRGPEQCRGTFTCVVTNEYGMAHPFLPIRLPMTPDEAKAKYAEQKEPVKPAEPEATIFRLKCVCGRISTGSPAELASRPCKCGKICCGQVTPVKPDVDSLLPPPTPMDEFNFLMEDPLITEE